jgi:hypothetical protein
LLIPDTADQFVSRSLVKMIRKSKWSTVSSDDAMIGRKNKEASPLSMKVEAFALELSQLIRGVRIYPAKHPTLLEVAKSVLHSAPLDSAGSLTISITSKELVVSRKFVAGRASRLASMLHAKVLNYSGRKT